MDCRTISEKIIELRDSDLELRARLLKAGKLSDGYNPEMEQLHNRNAEILNDIIETIGYPSIDKVGPEASEAAWLIIQHAISQPDFMKKCAYLLEMAIRENEANPHNLAYLSDRIAVLAGNPQLFGTQFDWDENAQLSPNPYDDIDKVNQRRKSIGLNTLEEQTALIRRKSQQDNQLPPEDFERRSQEFQEWREKVGWVD